MPLRALHSEMGKTVNFMSCVCMLRFSRVPFFMALRTVARQASLSMEFSGEEYWSVLPLPSPLDYLGRPKYNHK